MEQTNDTYQPIKSQLAQNVFSRHIGTFLYNVISYNNIMIFLPKTGRENFKFLRIE